MATTTGSDNDFHEAKLQDNHLEHSDGGLAGFDPNAHVMDKVKMNKRMLLCIIMIYTACCAFGFQAAIIGSTLGQPGFFATFPELLKAPNGSNLIGAVVSTFQTGGFLGVVIMSLLCDRFGRRSGYVACCFFSLLGAGLCTGAKTVSMFIVGRLFTGIGGWGVIMVSMVHLQELAPANFRGEFGAAVGPALNSGFLVANWTQYGLFHYGNPFNWRLAMLLQIVLVLAYMAMLPWVPESPRWLIWKDRRGEALEVFKLLHRTDKNDEKFTMAHLELYAVSKQVALDKTLDSSWKALFTKYWFRSFSVAFLMAINQLMGPQVITNYAVSIYEAAGLTPGNALLLQACWNIWGLIASLVWMKFVDVFGRKTLIQGGLLATLIIFSILTALYAQYVDYAANHTNPGPGRNGLFFIFYLYLVGYECQEPAMFAYVGEIFPIHMRARGIAIGLSSITITASWLTMAFSPGVTAAGWKFFLLPIGCMAAGLVVQHFIVKETVGHTLEQVGAVFGDGEDIVDITQNFDLKAFEAELEEELANHGRKV